MQASHDPILAITIEPTRIERFVRPFQRFIAAETSGGVILLVCTVIALLWANSAWAASYFHLWEMPISLSINGAAFTLSLHHFINDGLMAVFFFLVGLEIKREVMVGELSSLKAAALPIAAALGGMVVPATLYTLLNYGGDGGRGWGIPMATDIAFALGMLALLGRGAPLGLKVFLAALAIADDLGAVLVIALFYSAELSWLHLELAAGMLALLALANWLGVRRPLVYLLLGIVLWWAVLRSGVHATIAGVLAAMMIPARTRIDSAAFLQGGREILNGFERAGFEGEGVLTNQGQQDAIQALVRAAELAETPLQRLERGLHGWVAFGIIPLFALANAGVSLQGFGLESLAQPVTLGVVLGLVFGKPLGITLASWLAVRTGVGALPEGVSWRALHAVSWLAGIGFTMSLFIAGLAFGEPQQLDAAKVGVLAASALAALAGGLLLRGSGARGRGSGETATTTATPSSPGVAVP